MLSNGVYWNVTLFSLTASLEIDLLWTSSGHSRNCSVWLHFSALEVSVCIKHMYLVVEGVQKTKPSLNVYATATGTFSTVIYYVYIYIYISVNTLTNVSFVITKSEQPNTFNKPDGSFSGASLCLHIYTYK